MNNYFRTKKECLLLIALYFFPCLLPEAYLLLQHKGTSNMALHADASVFVVCMIFFEVFSLLWLKKNELRPIITQYQFWYATNIYTRYGIVRRLFAKAHTSKLFWRLLTSLLDSSQKTTPRGISPPHMSVECTKRPTLPRITTHDA